MKELIYKNYYKIQNLTITIICRGAGVVKRARSKGLGFLEAKLRRPSSDGNQVLRNLVA